MIGTDGYLRRVDDKVLCYRETSTFYIDRRNGEDGWQSDINLLVTEEIKDVSR